MTHSCPTRRSSDLRQQEMQPSLQDRDRLRQMEHGLVRRVEREVGLTRGVGDEGDIDGEHEQRQRPSRRHPEQRLESDHRIVDEAAEDENRSEEHTSELQSLMRISYAVFCLK